MITKVVRLNIAKADVENDKRQIGSLYGLPNGSKIIVYVGGRTFWEPHTASLLSEYVSTHHIEIEGNSQDVCDKWEHGILTNPFGPRGRR